MPDRDKPKKGGIFQVFKDIVYGMSPYYSLRLLPYVTPQISTWKRRMLRERDITDTLG